MRTTERNHCIACEFAEMPADGVMLCVAEARAIPARKARADGGDCGAEGVLFKKKQEKRDDDTHT